MKKLLIVGIVIMALLTGCVQQTVPSDTQVSPSATTPPRPTSVVFEITCSSEDFSRDRVYKNYADAWKDSAQFPNCEAKYVSGTIYSGAEQAAFEASKYENIDSVSTLYSLCSETLGIYFDMPTYSASQTDELLGMLTLCPEHPRASEIKAKLEAAAVHIAQRNAGTRFGPGLYVVGVDIQAGEYKTTSSVKDCYWERQDNTGRTIENDFVLAAPSVTVRIESTDTSFLTERCGEFVLVN